MLNKLLAFWNEFRVLGYGSALEYENVLVMKFK